MIKQIVQTAKSKLKRNQVQRKLVFQLTRDIAPTTIAGEKNFNIHAKVIKNFVKKNDLNGANDYVKKQKAKISQQTRDKGI